MVKNLITEKYYSKGLSIPREYIIVGEREGGGKMPNQRTPLSDWESLKWLDTSAKKGKASGIRILIEILG